MWADSRQAGSEATIVRPDGSRFTEYNVKRSSDRSGREVAECWLACKEGDAFEIIIQQARHQRVETDAPSVFTSIDGKGLPRGSLTFHLPSADSIWKDAMKNEYKDGLSRIGTIIIKLKSAERVNTEDEGSESVEETGARMLERLIAQRRLFDASEQDRQGTHEEIIKHPYWTQIFVFKYRDISVIEDLGLRVSTSSAGIPAPGLLHTRTRQEVAGILPHPLEPPARVTDFRNLERQIFSFLRPGALDTWPDRSNGGTRQQQPSVHLPEDSVIAEPVSGTGHERAREQEVASHHSERKQTANSTATSEDDTEGYVVGEVRTAVGAEEESESSVEDLHPDLD